MPEAHPITMIAAISSSAQTTEGAEMYACSRDPYGVAIQIIKTLHDRGAAPIYIRDAHTILDNTVFILWCQKYCEYAVLKVTGSFKHADIEGGGAPGQYYSGRLEQQQWHRGPAPSAKDAAYGRVG